jgi:hypothetical protein
VPGCARGPAGWGAFSADLIPPRGAGNRAKWTTKTPIREEGVHVYISVGTIVLIVIVILVIAFVF